MAFRRLLLAEMGELFVSDLCERVGCVAGAGMAERLCCVLAGGLVRICWGRAVMREYVRVDWGWGCA